MASRISWTRLGRNDDIGRETPNVQGTNLDGLYDAYDADHDPSSGMHDAEKIAYGGGYMRFDAAGTPPTYTLEQKYGIVSSITPDSTGVIIVTLAFGDWSQYSAMADAGAGAYFYKVWAQAVGSSAPRVAFATTLAATSFRLNLALLNEAEADGDISFGVFGRLVA